MIVSVLFSQKPPMVDSSTATDNYLVESSDSSSESSDSEQEETVLADQSSQAAIAISDTPSDRYFKVILLGDSNVGKTSLVYRVATGGFKPDFKATVGLDFVTRTFMLPDNGNPPNKSALHNTSVSERQVPVGVQFWDTAGTERYRSITRQYFKKSDGAILLYDVTDTRSFVNLRRWLQMLQDAADEDNVTVLICGTKVDLVEADHNARAVTGQTAKQLAEPFGAMFAEISSLTGSNVDQTLLRFLQEIKRKDDKRIRDAVDGVSVSQPSKINCCS